MHAQPALNATQSSMLGEDSNIIPRPVKYYKKEKRKKQYYLFNDSDLFPPFGQSTPPSPYSPNPQKGKAQNSKA